jgi:RNA polymerase sigma factor (sigma-70 family)
METGDRYRPSDEECALIEQLLTESARRGRLSPEDARDFVQSVHLHLLETQYEILRRFRGRSSLRTYLTVAIRRLLIDWQNHTYGRWRPSIAAVRLGPDAVHLERLMYRDGHTRDAAVEIAASRTDTPRRELRRLAADVPPRVKRQRALDLSLDDRCAPADPDPIEERERRHTRQRVLASLRDALDGLDGTDRQILYHRFCQGRTIRSLAVALDTEEKRLYRRLARVLASLRSRLTTVSHEDACVATRAAGADRDEPRRVRLDFQDA